MIFVIQHSNTPQRQGGSDRSGKPWQEWATQGKARIRAAGGRDRHSAPRWRRKRATGVWREQGGCLAHTRGGGGRGIAGRMGLAILTLKGGGTSCSFRNWYFEIYAKYQTCEIEKYCAMWCELRAEYY